MEKSFIIAGKLATLHFVTSTEDGWHEVAVRIEGQFTPAFGAYNGSEKNQAAQAFTLLSETLAALAAAIGK